jgi:hypothetical protein
LIQQIIKQRKEKAEKIQNAFRIYINPKKIKALLEREKDNFCIMSNIKYVKSLKLKIFLTGTVYKVVDFDYCKVRNNFIIYIPRNLVKNKKLKVNFISDDKVLIDSSFRTEYDSNGVFYNIIDFNKIEQEEEKQKKCYEETIYYNNLTFLRQLEIMEKDNKESIEAEISEKRFASGDELFLRPKAKRNSLSLGTKKNIFGSTPYLLINHKHKSQFNLFSPKSILKSPMGSKNNLLPKRVSFGGKIEYTF